YCLTGPISRPTTKLLVRLAISVGDKVRAEAENETLALGPSQETLPQEIYQAVNQALFAETQLARSWQKAKEAGTVVSAPAEKFGTAQPFDLSQETNQAGSEPAPILSFRNEIDGMKGQAAVARVARALKRTEPRGRRALLVFEDIVRDTSYQTNCRES